MVTKISVNSSPLTPKFVLGQPQDRYTDALKLAQNKWESIAEGVQLKEYHFHQAG